MSDLFLKDLPPCPLCGSDEYEGAGIDITFDPDGIMLKIEFGCECGLRMERHFADSRMEGPTPPFRMNLETTRRHIEEMITDFSKLTKKKESK